MKIRNSPSVSVIAVDRSRLSFYWNGGTFHL